MTLLEKLRDRLLILELVEKGQHFLLVDEATVAKCRADVVKIARLFIEAEETAPDPAKE